jgi:hypothetical protein
VRVQDANSAKEKRRNDMASLDALPEETVAHIQSAGCKAQKKSVIDAHSRCWGYLRGAISTHGEAKRNLEFTEGDQDRQLQQLWTETGIGDIGRMLEKRRKCFLKEYEPMSKILRTANVSKEQEDDRAADRDEIDPYNEVISGRRRPDSVAIEWTSKTLYILEFKRTSDQRQDY